MDKNILLFFISECLQYDEHLGNNLKKECVEYITHLKEENNKLKDNWNKLKEIVKSQSGLKKKCHNGELWFEVDDLLDTMQELEGDVLK